MGGDFGTIRQWRDEIRGGKRAGPRIVASGPYVQGGDAALPHFVVRTPEQAQAAVDSLAQLGVDFVKVHALVPRDAFFALARAARARGLPLAGHLQTDVTVEEAADSGQRSLEHLDGFLNPCSAADSVRLSAAHPLDRYVLGECSTKDQTPVYRHIAARPTWVTPTFIALEMLAALPKERLPSDTLAHYLPPTLRAAMAAALEIPPDMPADASVLGRALWAKRLEVVKGLAQSGVPILAGTDAPLPNSIPGFGMHAELEVLVRSGLSPWRALRTATAEPARYFASDTVGTVCAGCVADLVVLNADPLRDIRNTRRIALVVADGRAYTPAALASLRESALRAAKPATKSH
jgi:imidazolonepropionase-like amidohydrolase